MILVVGIAVGLIVAGLLICFLSGSAGRASLGFWWVGAVLAVCGVVLLLAPVIVFVAGIIRQALELH